MWDNVAKARKQLAANTRADGPTTQPAAAGGGGGALFSDGDNAGRAGGSASTSLQMAMEDKAVRAALAATLQRLPRLRADDGDVVGYAFAVNGKLDGGDVYASHGLFARLFPKLLNAAAVEAVIDRPAGQGSGDAPPPPSAERVTAAIAAVDAAAAKPVEVNGRVRPLANREAQVPDLDRAVAAADARNAPIGQAVPDGVSAGVGRTTVPRPALPPATVDRAKVFSRATADEYETRDTAVPSEPFLHRTYLAE